MDIEQAEELLEKYRRGECTPEEELRVEAWFETLPGTDWLETSEQKANFRERLSAGIDARTLNNPGQRTIPIYLRMTAAAVILFVLSFGLWTYVKTPVTQPGVVKTYDSSPAGNKAVLTLADGRKIILDSVANGPINNQGGIIITKTANGQLVYNVTAVSAPGSGLTYNTIETPRGGKYQVNLPDGTKVWLNSASSLRYPTHFKGNRRDVSLTGEGFFEVAKNKSRPFYVSANGTIIEVLGTHFNVMAYTEEKAVATTLLEGSVKVISAHASSVIRPGSQALSAGGTIAVNTSADMEEAIAWKEGSFVFNGADIRVVMRQLERWYNVDIDENTLPQLKLVAGISRHVKLSQVLRMMETTYGLQFKIEERRITLLK
jgi:transmembrane sensor